MVGQRVVVHFENQLTEPTGIHWHGIELDNASDGTPLTQNHVLPGDDFTYDFVVTRPGVFWYHPHHDSSTNQVFKGLYGSIIVTDPNEAALIAGGTIPGAGDTLTLALSDITVCKDADPDDNGDLSDSLNDEDTYDDALPWVGGGALPEQAGPFPNMLCESPIDEHGDPIAGPLPAGAVPNIQKHTGRVNEGQTVLTNGVNVGGRAGTPEAPGALAAGASTYDVAPGQGLRLQIGDAATTRFFRLRLTDSAGDDIPLVRIGGEGGLLDDAVLDGTSAGGFDFKYDEGEILLDPGDRADVVIAFPDDTPAGVATLWTEDFQRTGGGDGGGGWANLPTVPVAHFNVTGAAVPELTIGDGTPLRSATGDPQELLPAPTGNLLDPALFPTIQLGTLDQDIELTATGAFPGIDGVQGEHDFSIDYTLQPHLDSSRWGLIGDVLQLNIVNVSAAHHPFHLHGFSIQPLSYNNCPGAVSSFTFETEFVDNMDVPPGCTLTVRVRLEDRPIPNLTPGGGLGRWLFHCHIFFHHHQGMVSELAVVAPEVTITDVTPPALIYPVGTEVTILSEVLGEIAPTYDWDDGGVTTVGVNTSGPEYTSSHTFNSAGVYTVVVSVEKNGFSDSDSVLLVVFDPDAGFLTAGGNIDIAAGAVVADPTASGKATFSLNSKYPDGAVVPEGHLQFQLNAADFKFESETQQWLVVVGGLAQFTGTGTVNGTGNYGFLLTAYDGKIVGGPDRLRLRAWDIDNGNALVFDNVPGAPDDIDTANPQPIRAGSIVVHTGK